MKGEEKAGDEKKKWKGPKMIIRRAVDRPDDHRYRVSHKNRTGRRSQSENIAEHNLRKYAT